MKKEDAELLIADLMKEPPVKGIVEKAEDIETVVTGSKNEQNIMVVMPIILIAMIKMMSEDFARNFTTVTGVIATTIAIGMFIASYFIGRAVLDIKI